MNWSEHWWVLVLSAAAGSLPTAWIAVKLAIGRDVRSHGSGNVGATNAGRLLGWGGFAIVLAIDITKGSLPVVVAAMNGFQPGEGLWLGLAAVVGHCYTPWLGFRGGKGVATAAGAVAVANWPAVLAGASVWLLVRRISDLASVASLAGLAAAGIGVVGWGSPALWPPFAAISAVVLLRHSGNLRRLAAGTELRT